MQKNSLVALAEASALPEFQYMDKPTWRWIRGNDPQYRISNAPELRPFGWLRTLPLQNSWLAEQKLTDSLHGMRHFWRSAYFAFHLSALQKLSESETRQAVIASLLHDIRRLNDKADTGHAARSAIWFRKHAAELYKVWGVTLNAGDINAIVAAIDLHETPYEYFSPTQAATYAKYKITTDIVKTADALDRYRLPKLSWWPRDARLRLVPPGWLKQLAFEVVLASEGRFLQTADNIRSLEYSFRLFEGTLKDKRNAWEKAHPIYPDPRGQTDAQ